MTINLAIGAFILFMVVGISVGVISALRRGKPVDRVSMGVALFFYSFPVFFIGLVLLYFVKIKWRIIPASSSTSRSMRIPSAYFQVMILPWITLALLYAAFYSRLDAQPDARDPGRGLHPDGARQGPAASASSSASTPSGPG